jgi:hypothetical protein
MNLIGFTLLKAIKGASQGCLLLANIKKSNYYQQLMKFIMLKICLMIPLILSSAFLSGQTATPWVVNSSGGEASTETISITWSMGELITQTFYAGEKILTQGLLQPEILVSNLVENFDAKQLPIKVFPNPTMEHLNISLDDFSSRMLSYALYDIRGELVRSGNIQNSIETFSVVNLTPSVYFLRILEANKIIKVFKIVKQ